MADISKSFEEVADWCERHLETRHGREVGMTFGGLIRAYGRLAAKPHRRLNEEEKVSYRRLDAQAEVVMLDFCRRFRTAGEPKKLITKVLEPRSQVTNTIYDPGPPRV